MPENDNSFLDKIRIDEGNEKCKTVFREVCNRDKRRAVFLINDSRLTFPCLFILMPLIESFQLERNLGPRSAMALRIIRSIRKGAGNHPDELSRRNGQVHALLKWILETGHDADGLSDDYDEILDVAVSILIIMYQDTAVLPATLDLIFERNRKARNIHTLVWAAFKSRNPSVLKLIA